MSKFKNNFILLLTAIIAMSTGLWYAKHKQTDKVSLHPPKIQGAILPIAKTITPFALINHLGEAYTEKNLKNNWSLIFVGYTHCPDVCPTTLSLMTSVNEELKLQNLQPLNIIFLSIDPERDTPEVMKRYIEYFDAEFTGVTGELSAIKKLSNNLNAAFQKSPGLNGKINDEDYLMDHSSALLLINPDGNLQSIITAPQTLGNVIDSFLKSQVFYNEINQILKQ
jgi:protein SCO1/2